MFNLCDIHFHTNLSFDGYENDGGENFDIPYIYDNYMKDIINPDNSVKLVCASDHNIFIYDKYLKMKEEFAQKDVLLLPAIEINGNGAVHWVIIFNNIQLESDNIGNKLEDKIYELFQYDRNKNLLSQTKAIQPKVQNVLDLIKILIDLKIEFLAIPHMDKSNGWYSVLKKHPEQMNLMKYLLCDGIINGFESKKMQNAILDKIRNTEKYVNLHAKELTELQEKIDSEKSDDKKRELEKEQKEKISELQRERDFLDIPMAIQEIIDINDTASVYGSDYHGKSDMPYNRENLFFMTSDVTFNGLKFSLLDWKSRIFSFKRKEKHSKSGNYVIDNIELLINGEKKIIEFGSGLNSIIGSRGTGKSYLISCMIGKNSVYDKSTIGEQIKLNKINFVDHSAVDYLDERFYDYISQKNGINHDEKNIYDLLAKAPYNFEEFRSGINKFYNPNIEKSNNIGKCFEKLNELLASYIKIYKQEEQKIDLNFIDKYNDFYKNQSESLQISNLFNDLNIKLGPVITNNTIQIKNVKKFKDDISILLKDYETIKDYKNVKEIIKDNKLVKTDFESLKELKDLIENKSLPIVEKDYNTHTLIKEHIDSIISEMSKDFTNVKNVLDDNINKLQTFISSSVKLLKDSLLIKEQLDAIIYSDLEDKEVYQFDSETNKYKLIVSEKINFKELTEKQLSEILTHYRSSVQFTPEIFIETITNTDFGEKYIEVFYPNINKRSNDYSLCKPTIESNIIFEKNHEKYDWKLQSPGQRSDLLLDSILTSNSSKILIIDQPEDDLDNETIFNKIVKLIRNIKLNRQVIIVTHNANLAITADSEKIIICENCLGKYGLISNTMESTNVYEYHSLNRNECTSGTIIMLACNILEGGKKAIKSRINKIGLRELLYEE